MAGVFGSMAKHTTSRSHHIAGGQNVWWNSFSTSCISKGKKLHLDNFTIQRKWHWIVAIGLRNFSYIKESAECEFHMGSSAV